MATTRKNTPRRQSPTVPLRCPKCRNPKVRVTRDQQDLKRTFRRDSGQTQHLHASCSCPRCKHKWWSAHETALRFAKLLVESQRDAMLVGPEHKGLSSLPAQAEAT